MTYFKITRSNVLCIAILLTLGFFAQTAFANGSITGLDKRVAVLKAGTTEWSKATANMVLGTGDRVFVRSGSSLTITLKDGSIFDVKGGSDVTIMDDRIIINHGSIVVVEGSVTAVSSKGGDPYMVSAGNSMTFARDGSTSGLQPVSPDYGSGTNPSPNEPEQPASEI